MAICWRGVRVSAPTVTSSQTSAFSEKTSEPIPDPQLEPIWVEKTPSVSGVMAQVPVLYSSDPTVEASKSLKTRLVLLVMGVPPLSSRRPWKESCLLGPTGVEG